MRRIPFVACAASILILAGAALAQPTYVNGPIPTQTWDQSQSPYYVTGPINVEAGATLTINSGVEVLFNADEAFVVNGTLEVWGDESGMVRFAPGSSAEWGGIRLLGGTSSTIQWAEITGVVSDTAGGGIYLSNLDTHLELLHSVIHHNSSITFGGGIACVTLASVNVTKCTFVANTAGSQGGGLYGTVAPTYLTESIVWGNSPDQIVQGLGTFKVLYTDVQDGVPASAIDSIGNINVDPMFSDPANFDYHLTMDSPCIDVGDPNSPYDPDGTVADIGAFYYDQSGGGQPQQLNIETGTVPQPEIPTAISISPLGPYVAVGSGVGHVFIWDMDQQVPTIIDTLTGSVGQVSSVEYSPDGTIIVAGYDDGWVYAWDNAGQPVWSLYLNPVVSDVAMSPVGGNIAVCGPGGFASVLSLADGQPISALQGIQSDVTCLTYDNSGNTVFGGGCGWHDLWLGRHFGRVSLYVAPAQLQRRGYRRREGRHLRHEQRVGHQH